MKKRVLYFDVLKVVAVFFVILIHVVSEYWDTININSNSFIGLSFLDSLSRFCVPIYFMVSGALFLREEKEITIKDVLTKYIPRILIIFIFWNLAYSFLNILILGDKTISFKEILTVLSNTVLGKGIFHLYFLPILMGFYLCLPVLKLITKKENKDILKYLILLLFIFISLNKLLNYALNTKISYSILFGGYLIYFIIGYYLNTFEINDRNKRIIYLSSILGFVITFAGTIICSRLFGKTEVFFNYLSFNVILYSSGVFLFAKNKIKKFNEKVLNILTSTHFGIYLIHGLVLGLFEVIGMFKLFDKLTVPVSVVLSSIVIYLVSLISIFIVIKIPLVRNLVILDKKR